VRRATIRQHGFAAIAAIFLVVVLAALGGFMVTFSNTQQLTSAQDVQGSRAYWAARAGLEWALVAIPTNPGLCAAPVVAPPSIPDFTVAINCSKQDYTENGVSLTIYQMTSNATAGGAAGSISRIERSVSASLEQSP